MAGSMIRCALLFVLLTVSGQVVYGQTCTATDESALLYFCREIVFARTEFATWKDNSNCCGWDGVSCNGQGSVIYINVANADIVTPNPAGAPYFVGTGLGDLTALQNLTLINIPFNGWIPPAWGRGLPNLQVLNIDGSNLAGPLPSELCSLTNLRTLILKDNQLTGSVPSCFTNPRATFPNLQLMNLTGNRFSGAVPSFP